MTPKEKRYLILNLIKDGTNTMNELNNKTKDIITYYNLGSIIQQLRAKGLIFNKDGRWECFK